MTDEEINEPYRIPDELWEQIKPLLPPELPKSKDNHPRMDDRKAMEAILHVFRTGCEWEDLPHDLGAPNTVRGYFHKWRESGVFQRMWRAGILTYDELRTIFWHGKPLGNME